MSARTATAAIILFLVLLIGGVASLILEARRTEQAEAQEARQTLCENAAAIIGTRNNVRACAGDDE